MIRNVCQAMLLLILFTHILVDQSLAQEHTPSVDMVFKNITDPSIYNKWFMPPLHYEKPLDVQIRAFVYNINTKESNTLKISVTLLLEILWKDTRLSYDEGSTGLSMITGGKIFLEAIWTPHIFLNNNFESHVLGTISEDCFITLLPSGSIIFTTRVKATMSCVKHLAKFPFDHQNCELSIQSWVHNSSKQHLSWDTDSPLEFRDLKSSCIEFDVVSVENMSYKAENTHSEERLKSISIRIMLARRYGYYFLNYYLPSILIVMVSWVSFWLCPSAVPGRITLGASTMLTFIQLCWSAQEEQKISEFMVYDVWACTCTAFIFFTLVEFSFVNTIDRKGRGRKLYLKKLSSKHIFRGGVHTATGRAQLRRSSSCPSSPELRRHFARKQDTSTSDVIKELKKVSISLGNLVEEESKDEEKLMSSMFSMTPQEIAKWIDDKSKIVFPIAFVIFNISYWLPIIIVE